MPRVHNHIRMARACRRQRSSMYRHALKSYRHGKSAHATAAKPVSLGPAPRFPRTLTCEHRGPAPSDAASFGPVRNFLTHRITITAPGNKWSAFPQQPPVSWTQFATVTKEAYPTYSQLSYWSQSQKRVLSRETKE